MTASCRKESWSKEFFDCISASDGSKSGDRACDARLTPAQQAAAKAAAEEVASEAGQGQSQDPEPKEPSREDEIAANAAKLEAARRAAEAATTDAERAAVNAWNTYTKDGLPDSPIANPGLASIQAAVAPAEGPWLFFVAVNPETGETKFAATQAEHDTYVAQFQAWCNAAENQGKCSR